MFIKSTTLGTLVNIDRYDMVDIVPVENGKHLIVASDYKKGSVTLARYNDFDNLLKDFEKLCFAIARKCNYFEFSPEKEAVADDNV